MAKETGNYATLHGIEFNLDDMQQKTMYETLREKEQGAKCSVQDEGDLVKFSVTWTLPKETLAQWPRSKPTKEMIAKGITEGKTYTKVTSTWFGQDINGSLRVNIKPKTFRALLSGASE